MIQFSEAAALIIMTDCQPLCSDNLQTSSIRADEGHHPGLVDEHDSDADTIRMSSPELWDGVNVENLPVIPNSLILSECDVVRPPGYEW